MMSSNIKKLYLVCGEVRISVISNMTQKVISWHFDTEEEVIKTHDNNPHAIYIIPIKEYLIVNKDK